MVPTGWTQDPARLDALERISRALKAAKAAKRRGFNIQLVKATLMEATRAWTARDYASAVDLANRAMVMLGEPPLP